MLCTCDVLLVSQAIPLQRGVACKNNVLHVWIQFHGALHMQCAHYGYIELSELSEPHLNMLGAQLL